jgi:hypothetical protein
VAQLLVTDDVVTVSLSAIEKAEAVHGDVSVPRTAVVSAQVVPDGMDEVHGLRVPGTGLPGVIMVGTWRGVDPNLGGSSLLCAYCGNDPAWNPC